MGEQSVLAPASPRPAEQRWEAWVRADGSSVSLRDQGTSWKRDDHLAGEKDPAEDSPSGRTAGSKAECPTRNKTHNVICP